MCETDAATLSLQQSSQSNYMDMNIGYIEFNVLSNV